MPLPIPLPPPIAPPAGTSPRQQPHWYKDVEGWATQQVLDSHHDALYSHGEYAMFVLMWHPGDFRAGLVGRCQVCSAQSSRAFAAYEQPTRRRCPSCFGTTFEGGYRARIVRPSLWLDRTQDTVEGRRGEVRTSYLALETTFDFTLHAGDYIFRLGGDRYACAELDSPPVRTGFESPAEQLYVGGVVDKVALEDPSSVAYAIPPTAAEVDEALALAAGAHLVPSEPSPWEDVRGPLAVSY
jgi:hypothetical protein